MGMKNAGEILILCDFDGTICNIDMGNELLNRFMDKRWQEVDRAYSSGEIGSRDAYSQVSSLFRGTREELLEFARNHGGLDPFFMDFYTFCTGKGFDLKIVSDGLDIYICEILKKYRLENIDYFTNAAIFNNGRLSIEFPQMNEDCRKCGTCKTGVLKKLRPDYASIFYIGDGHSDFCPSKDADLVFAKDILYRTCKENGIPCEHYENFKDIQDYMIKSYQ